MEVLTKHNRASDDDCVFTCVVFAHTSVEARQIDSKKTSAATDRRRAGAAIPGASSKVSVTEFPLRSQDHS